MTTAQRYGIDGTVFAYRNNREIPHSKQYAKKQKETKIKLLTRSYASDILITTGGYMNYLIRDITPELHKALKIKAAKNETTIKKIVLAAIERAAK